MCMRVQQVPIKPPQHDSPMPSMHGCWYQARTGSTLLTGGMPCPACCCACSSDCSVLLGSFGALFFAPSMSTANAGYCCYYCGGCLLLSAALLRGTSG
jgi:hypothetical protein